jgi:hypothetical protein
MFTRTFALNVAQRQKRIPSKSSLPSQPLLIRAAVLTFLCSIIMVLSVVLVARSGKGFQIFDLPSQALPGSPLPPGTRCSSLSDAYYLHCTVIDREVYFTREGHTLTTIHALIPAREFTLGTLIAAWGTPTGISWLGNKLSDASTVYVHWETFYAQLSTRSLHPDSRVGFIVYELAQSPTLLWRGFTSGKD